ncbi:MAG: hypothetical protein P9X24_10875 [Candidatus Hatepunaea meridiana]|nr:hypothetical protein [Candidatus Hatepunaea meridiana]
MNFINSKYPNLITLFLISAICLSLQAEPRRLYGDVGVDLWSMSVLDYKGIFPVRNGEALLVIWSENTLETNERHHCMQILNSDGTAELESPLRLSSIGSKISKIYTVSDLSGNIYAVWIEHRPGEHTAENLYVQKYSSSGESLWNQEPVRFEQKTQYSLNDEGLRHRIEKVIPDERGGCYVKLRGFDMIALGGNGMKRSDWKPEGRQNFPWSILDNEGGFWYFTRSGNRNPGYSYVVKRINHQGEVLWEDSSLFKGDIPERDMKAWQSENIIAYKNGLIIINEIKQESVKLEGTENKYERKTYPGYISLYQIDKNGFFRGKKYYHQIRIKARNPRFTILNDGKILISYQYYENKEVSIWATIYDPRKNKFPWGMEGRKVAGWKSNEIYDKSPKISMRYRFFKYGRITQLNNGDIVFQIRLDLSSQDGPKWIAIYRMSIEGEHVWEAPYIIAEDVLSEQDIKIIGSPSQFVSTLTHNEIFILPGLNDCFWLTSFLNNTNTGGKLEVNLHDYNGRFVQKNSLKFNSVTRFKVDPISVWVNDDNLTVLAFHKWNGFIAFDVDKRGAIVGDPMGRMVIPTIDQVTINQTLRVKDKTILLWSPSYKVEDRGFEKIYLSTIDPKGELIWTKELSNDFTINPKVQMQLKLTPDKMHVVVTATSNKGYYPYKVFWVDILDGQIVWAKQLFGPQNLTLNKYSRRSLKYRNEVIINENEIYCLYLSYKNVIFVSRMNHKGEEFWEVPFRRPIDVVDQFVGAKFHEKDGIYYLMQKNTYSMVITYGRNLLSNGVRRDQTYYVYTTPYEKVMGPAGRFFIPSFSGKNMWVVPTVYLNYGIQCVDSPWKRLMGDRGTAPVGFDQSRSGSRILLQGTPDGTGGLWAVWHDPMRVTHYNSQAKLQEGWSKEWIPVFKYKQNFKEHKEFLLQNGDLVIFGMIEHGRKIKIQRIREGE